MSISVVADPSVKAHDQRGKFTPSTTTATISGTSGTQA